MRDFVGERGELIAMLRLTDFHNRGPMFRPRLLGEKWPSVDLFVQLEGVQGQTPFFLVQVRATKQPIRGSLLPISIDKTTIAELAGYPAPGYIIGVDERNKEAFIVAHGRRRQGFRGLSTEFPLNAATRQLLWQEVAAFWADSQSPSESAFLDPRWRKR
jgi:hypothetical protein